MEVVDEAEVGLPEEELGEEQRLGGDSIEIFQLQFWLEGFSFGLRFPTLRSKRGSLHM